MSKKVVHVIGTGTIGEPLIGMMSRHADAFGIDEVTFHKNTPSFADRPKVAQLQRHGARLAAGPDKAAKFEELGIEVAYEAEEAIKRATVVIDCTPSGVGRENKHQFYDKYANQVRGFIAQGSEFGFGKMYARGINDQVLDADKDQFLQVVSCNTHNLSVLLKTLGDNGSGGIGIDEGRFLCLRRANDISQDDKFVPAPQVGKHADERFGTHHARDAHHLFRTLGYDFNLYSSACMLPTQYMHAIHFSIRVPFKLSHEDVLARFTENRRVAVTGKKSSNTVFSFGREHGLYGRILSQTVVSLPTVAVRDNKEVVGFCFTPQDGNSLLSSIAATLWFLDRDSLEERIDVLRQYMYQEI
jgi:glyceraldehyde-3-phosphate dehydrogenase (NAD(P))